MGVSTPHTLAERQRKRGKMARPICPNCGELDAVQKVSAIYSMGTSLGQYKGHDPLQIKGQTFLFPVQKEIKSTTRLAQSLAPPTVPPEPIAPQITSRSQELEVSLNFMLLGIGSMFFTCLSVFTLASALPIDDRYLETDFFLIILIVLSVITMFAVGELGRRWYSKRRIEKRLAGKDKAYNRKVEHYEQDIRHYNSAKQKLERWQMSYYCGRCDLVFVHD